MKPNYTTPQTDRFAAGPKIDQQFQTDLSDFNSRCGGECPPSFLKISESYFRHEAPKNFIRESALFLAIVLTSAWPVVKACEGLFFFARSLAF